MADLFDLKAEGYFYTRLAKLTNDVVAAKIAALKEAWRLCSRLRQRLLFYSAFNICQAGDHFVSAVSIYGGTYNLAVTMKKLGIEVTLVDQDADEEEILKAFRPNTKALGETITNPGSLAPILKNLLE